MSGKFIVVFKDHVSEEQINKFAEDVTRNDGEVTKRFDGNTIKGFAATLPQSFFQQLKADDAIDFIEPDGVVTTQQA